MRILVTGGAGYIGSHTAKQLATAGHTPIVVDDLSAGHAGAVQWGPLIEADIGDAAAVAGILAEHDPDAVVHFAGSAYVGESMADPGKYFRNNTMATLTLLEVITKRRPVPFVFSSTCATYGIPGAVPIAETTPQTPVNPYGDSKLFIEGMLRWFGTAHGLPWMALRYFNAAGADHDGELGEIHDPETHLIPLVLDAALGRSTVKIFGTDYPTPDGTAIRDYIHVTDLASAHLLAVDHLAAGGESRALNLGTGIGHSVRQVIAAAETASGRTVAYHEAARRAGDPPQLVADASLAGEVLEWRPKMSDLATITETAWRWHTRNEGS